MSYQPRLQIALYLTQDSLLPIDSARTPSSSSSSSRPPNGSSTAKPGYGPTVASEDTPLSRIVDQVLSVRATEPTPAEAAVGWVGSGGRTEYDLVCLPLANAKWQERWERMCTVSSLGSTETELVRQAVATHGRPEVVKLEAEQWRAGGNFRVDEVNVTKLEESTNLLPFASEWLDLDSPVEGIRFDSELALRQEISYASYLSMNAIVLPAPRFDTRQYLTDYARAVNGALTANWHMHISVRIPIALQGGGSTSRPGTPAVGASADEQATAAWGMWNTVRAACSYSPRLSVTLDLTSNLPSPAVLAQWSAEPVKHVYLPCSTFIPNAKGYPVLSKSMQTFLKSIFKFNPTFIIAETHSNLHTSGGSPAYAQYIRYLHRKSVSLDPVEQYAQGYLDQLQQPLQPLMDNLEGETYEGFEKDPVKYRQYEEAVYRALCDRPASLPVTIFVVGAGRGPLVAGCIKAAERARRQVRLTAVEKNPNAFVVLQERQALEWGSAVELVYTDMRTFNPRDRADIIVSELLGSFGDNELSPECLDGVMRCLKPDGISIPSSYTSFLAPISSAKLHADVTVPVASSSTTVLDGKPAEQPYVVMFSAAHILSANGQKEGMERVQECWGFDHPRPDVVVDDTGLPYTNHHNARSAHLTFYIPQTGVCHGFAGYFEAILYDDVGLSIHPERSARDMLSWFPIFFPLCDPLYLPAHSELDVQIWRMIDNHKRKVWFEWSAEVYLSASSLVYSNSLSPPTVLSPTSSILTGRQTFSSDAPSQRAHSPWDTRRANGSAFSPMMEAFASAPSPAISSVQSENAGRMRGIEEDDRGEVRIKIGQSKLHNPQGRTSWVGL